jgi:hypothetical protein
VQRGPRRGANPVVKNTELTASHLVLYLGDVTTQAKIGVPLRAVMPAVGTAAPSSAYLYYKPEISISVSTPQIVVLEPL